MKPELETESQLAHRNQLRPRVSIVRLDPLASHRLAMSYEDERVCSSCRNHLDEPAGVLVVEMRIDLIDQTERLGRNGRCEHQLHGGEGFLHRRRQLTLAGSCLAAAR